MTCILIHFGKFWQFCAATILNYESEPTNKLASILLADTFELNAHPNSVWAGSLIVSFTLTKAASYHFI